MNENEEFEEEKKTCERCEMELLEPPKNFGCGYVCNDCARAIIYYGEDYK